MEFISSRDGNGREGGGQRPRAVEVGVAVAVVAVYPDRACLGNSRGRERLLMPRCGCGGGRGDCGTAVVLSCIQRWSSFFLYAAHVGRKE